MALTHRSLARYYDWLSRYHRLAGPWRRVFEPHGLAVHRLLKPEGPGIAPADRERLFERFFVGPSDRHARGEGIGLGLPTALAIAQAHGGTIEVDSRPGEGTTFGLAVPVDGPPEEG